MIKSIKFKNFRAFKEENFLNFLNDENKLNKVMGLTGFSSSGKSTVLSFCEFIPVLWNFKVHYFQFVRTEVLATILKEYKEKNLNFMQKYKTPIAFQESEEFKNKYDEIYNLEATSKNFLKCNLFKMNIGDKNVPLICEISYLLSNNDYITHKMTLDIKNNKVSEEFVLNDDQLLEKKDSEIFNFESNIHGIFKKYNENYTLFINLSNLSKIRIAVDEQNRRHFGVKIQPKHQKMFKLFLNLFDPNISEINYNQDIPVSYLLHKNSDEISFNDLSTGTRKAIYLWSQIYQVLIIKLNDAMNNFFFIYDEIQDNWNLALIDLIFYLFKNQKFSGNSCQLLFSTHNPIIMENFENNQIFLISNNLVKRADEVIKDKNKNFAKCYLYDKLVKNNYKEALNEFIKELQKS